jgi:uncharacterized membrane protein
MKYLFYIFIPLPFVFSFFWLLSIFAFWLGLIAPFLFAIDQSYPIFEALIFSLIYHFVMGSMLMLIITLIEKYELNINFILTTATIQIICISAYLSETPIF